MTERGKYHDKYLRQLAADASDRITGPRLTVRIDKATVARCPATGELVARDSDTFKKLEHRLAP
ncbi:hypothetical protein OS190_16130 [Sulfitobacter sp. F26204]|uniref:hypothetical protein n=1 Tax=Sulfitobacter sp. F26204 TaxID=2996014 RepID=UPI00225DFCCC|nr:hypothetical protein [Sulfitobacter sp. F26204]MCX7561098.1 hypothetical protein [Sulfitobacter sp. F26204]